MSMSSDMGISPSGVRLLSCLFLSWLLRYQDPMFHGSFLYRLWTIVHMSLRIAAAASKCEYLVKGTWVTYLSSIASCRLGNRRWRLTDDQQEFAQDRHLPAWPKTLCLISDTGWHPDRMFIWLNETEKATSTMPRYNWLYQSHAFDVILGR